MARVLVVPWSMARMWVARPAAMKILPRSGGEAAEAHGGLAAQQPARRHDQHAVVIGSADLAPIIMRDHRAGARDHLEAAKILSEREAVAGDGDGVGDGDDALRLGRPRPDPRRPRPRPHPPGGGGGPGGLDGGLPPGPPPKLAAFGPQ